MKRTLFILIDAGFLVWFIYAAWEYIKLGSFFLVLILFVGVLGFLKFKRERKQAWYKIMLERVAPVLRIVMTILAFAFFLFFGKDIARIDINKYYEGGGFDVVLVYFYCLATISIALLSIFVILSQLFNINNKPLTHTDHEI